MATLKSLKIIKSSFFNFKFVTFASMVIDHWNLAMFIAPVDYQAVNFWEKIASECGGLK